MTAQEKLSEYGITVELAQQWIYANMNDLQLIFDTCKTFGINNDMIAEVLGNGLTSVDVEGYLNYYGFNPAELGFNLIEPTFMITNEWLSQWFEKPVYDIYMENESVSYSTIVLHSNATASFKEYAEAGTPNEHMTDSATTNYSLNADGVLIFGDAQNGYGYNKAVEMVTGMNALKVEWADNYNEVTEYYSNDSVNVELWAFDDATKAAIINDLIA